MARKITRPAWLTWKSRSVRLLTYASCFAGAAVAGALYSLWTLSCSGNRCPAVTVLDSYQPSQTSKLYAVDGRFVAELGIERRTLITIEEIPEVVKQAFVITEDKRFYDHGGIDWFRIPGSAIRNVMAGAFAQGFSTITMQLARNVFPEHISRDKSVIRKVREGRVARAIEDRYPKDKILELYLNQINLGAGAHGVETASQRYFGKSVREVNVAEAATLAAIPKAPTRYNPRRYPDRAIQRRNTIIELMRRNGAVTDQDASLAKAFPLQLAQGVESGDVAPYFVEWVRQQLEEKFGERLYDEGMRVFTSLDLDLQTAADRAMEAQLRTIEGGKFGKYTHTTFEQYVARSETSTNGESPYLQGAFIALDPRDGSVRVMVGGRDFNDSKFNRASQAMRQPGSTFKPIVYATAIQSGMGPGSQVEDSPISMPQVDGSTWTPGNFDGKFEGTITMRRALAQSRNLVAIRLGMQLGEDAVIRTARQFGITTPIPAVPSIHIGSADVYPLQMVAAYSVFANLGKRVEPHGILRVENSQGEVIWEPRTRTSEALSPAEAWLVVSMMKDVVQQGTAAGSVWGAGFRVPSGGKTGTTNDGADVWFIGYTADLVAGVWMGFDRPRKIMSNAQGGRLAAPAYTQFMLEAYRRKPEPPDWPRPAGVVVAQGCAGTDYFLAGTEMNGCGPETSNPFAIPLRVDSGAIAARPGGADKGKGAVKAKADTANPFKIPQ